MFPLLNFNLIANNTKLINGIWYSKSISNISYPEEGNTTCFQLEERSFWFKHRNSVILETINNFPPPGDYLLDVGGGNGFVSSAIEGIGFTAVLVEPGIRGIQNAQKRGIKNLVCSSLEDLQIRESSVPAIGLFDVLEHIEKDNEFLTQIFGLLTFGGRVYLTVPANNYLWSGEDIYAGHYRRYKLGRLVEIFKKAGFNVEYQTYFFSILPVPVFFFRTLPFKIGLKGEERELDNKIKEHSKRRGITGRILEFIWSWELKKIKSSEYISYGGSCLIVATKSVNKL